MISLKFLEALPMLLTHQSIRTGKNRLWITEITLNYLLMFPDIIPFSLNQLILPDISIIQVTI